jgi:hypothetical protein
MLPKSFVPLSSHLSLARLETLLLLIIQGSPHFSQFFSNLPKGDLRVLFLDPSAILLAKEHESRKGLLAFGALDGLLLQ